MHPFLIRSILLLLSALPGLSSPPDPPDSTFVNSLGMAFKQVPGSKNLLGVKEVTVAQYREFCKATNRDDPAFFFEQDDDEPVVGISYRDAVEFCAWLGRKERRVYRLPNDDEWSRAAGLGWNPAGSSQGKPSGPVDLLVFFWRTKSSSPPPYFANYASVEIPEEISGPLAVWTNREGLSLLKAREDRYQDGFAFTAPVGSYEPHGKGFYDLAGNVHEWTQTDASEASPLAKIVRGGGWLSYLPRETNVKSRIPLPEEGVYPDVGFRILLEKQ